MGFYAISGEINGSATSITSADIFSKRTKLISNTRDGKINIAIPKNYTIKKVDLFSANGKIIHSIDENTRLLDISHVPCGVYMVSLHVEGHQIIDKIIKR